MMAVWCGLSYALLGYILDMAGSWNMIVRLVIAFGVAFPTGLLSVALLLAGLDHLRRNIAALVPWAWVTWGMTIPGSVVAAFWIAQLWDWHLVWLIAAGCFALMAGQSFWLQGVADRNKYKAVSVHG